MNRHPQRRGRRYVGVAGATIALIAALGLLTACGSSSDGDEGAAAAEQAAPAANDEERALLAFAECMRDNGVPNFPDPVVNADGTYSFPRPQGVQMSAVQDTFKECRSLLPEGFQTPGQGADPEQQDALLEFARCMREQGVDVPDPTATGGIHGMFANLDAQSPTVQAAIQQCQQYLAGVFGHGGG